MDSKNIILTVALCICILVGWNYVADYMGWIPKPDPALVAQQQKAVQQPSGEQGTAPAPAVSAPLAPGLFTPSEGRSVTVQTPLYKAIFHSGGGFLKSFELRHYRMAVTPGSARVNLVDDATAATAPLGLIINGQPSWNTGRWAFEGEDLTLQAGQQGTLRLIGEVDGLRVERELQFTADSYLISERTSLYSLGDATRTVRMAFTTGASMASVAAGGTYDPMRIGWSLNGKFNEETSASDLSAKGVTGTGGYGWAAAMSNYFMNAILPAEPDDLTLKGRLQNEVFRVALERPDTLMNPGEMKEVALSYWYGPKDRNLLKDAPNNLVQSIDLGIFSIIATALMWLLDFFHSYVGNWGIAIILLTIVIKILFWPLTAKSYKSMEKMKKLNPMILKIREKYANDKQSMNKEIMDLYKTYGVNPASGCVPILVQLPVFFGLYQALMTALELRHSSFIMYLPGTDWIWLADLSTKDPTYITPLLMGATMFIQQKLTPTGGDPMQQKIMLFLPIVFTFLFLSFPSGLVVYWLVNNVLSIAQQWMMLRKVKE
jgi:YidC/Oxa1 family membrane protein insertase